MEVVGFQLVIVFSVALFFWKLGERKALYLSIFWSLWTVRFIFSPLLIITQLLFTWGTFFVCKKFSKNQKVIDGLRKVLDQEKYPEKEQRRYIEASQKSSVFPIRGEQHRQELIDAVISASDRLIILSGWIVSYVVNDRFASQLETAIKRGVQIYIGYGWEDSYGNHKGTDSHIEAMNRLERLKGLYSGNLHVGKFANHQKILIKDDEYIVCGSNNWLSNNLFKNAEMSLKIFSPSLTKSEGERFSRDIIKATS